MHMLDIMVPDPIWVKRRCELIAIDSGLCRAQSSSKQVLRSECSVRVSVRGEGERVYCYSART